MTPIFWYIRQGEFDKALADLTRAIELNPAKKNYYVARAAAYRSLKKDDLAAADDKRAAQLK